ncbi:hypothetical protein MCEMIEM28_00922 [Burkholderiaceae bacterium]
MSHIYLELRVVLLKLNKLWCAINAKRIKALQRQLG